MEIFKRVKNFVSGWWFPNADFIESDIENSSVCNKRINDENINEERSLKRRKLTPRSDDEILEFDDLFKTPVRGKKSSILAMQRGKKQCQLPRKENVDEIVEIQDDDTHDGPEVIDLESSDNDKNIERISARSSGTSSSSDIQIVGEYSLTASNTSGNFQCRSTPFDKTATSLRSNLRFHPKIDSKPLKELNNRHSMRFEYTSEDNRKAVSTSSESSHSTANSFKDISKELSLNKIKERQNRSEFLKFLRQYAKPTNKPSFNVSSSNISRSPVTRNSSQQQKIIFHSYSSQPQITSVETSTKMISNKLTNSISDKSVIDLTSEDDDEVQRQEILSNVVSSDVIKNLKTTFVGKGSNLADEELISNVLKKYATQLRVNEVQANNLRIQIREHNKDFNRTLSEILEQRLSIKEDEKVEIEEQKPSFEIAPITKAMTAAINQIVASKKVPLVQIKDTAVKLQDIRTLENSAWLNDEVINAYMNLIKMRGESKLDKYPKVHCFNTFLYEQLQKKGYNSVRRWTKKIDIFDYSMLIIPIHLGNHWCLTQIQIKEKSIRYFDSMGSPNNKCLRIMMQYLVEEFKDKKNGQLDPNEWELINLPPDEIPQQRNMHDCGVFACTFAEHLTRQAPFNFKQEHMPYFRVKMIYEILTGELLL